MDLFSLTDAFFTITKNGTKIYQSEVEKDTLNPYWKEFEIYVNPSTMLELTVFDHDDMTAHDLIGCVSFKPQDLVDSEIVKLVFDGAKNSNPVIMMKLS